jgi:hypothetical protein
VSLDALSQCIATEAHNVQARIPQRGAAAATVERDPNLVRKLSADLMKAQRGQQTDRCLRRRCGNECETVMLRHRGIGQPVVSPCNAFESSGTNQPTQSLSVDIRFCDFLPRHRAMPAGEAKQAS